jgi:tetratricopeptide (TPR) repeat protein
MNARLLLSFLILWAFAAELSFTGCGPKTAQEQDTLNLPENGSAKIRRLTLAIEENPNNPDLYFDRAKAYMEEKLFEKGIADIEQSLQLDSFRVDYLLLASDLYYTTKQVPKAKTAIERALTLEPEHVDANTRMGELQYYLGDFASAFKHLDAALKVDPFNARIYFTKGMVFKENGDTNLAISSFMTAIEQDPDYFHAYMQLADISARRDDPIAIQYYNNAIRSNPMMPEAHYGLGYFLQNHGNPRGAIKVYQDLLSVDPNYVPAMHNIGYIFLFDLESPADAMAWFDKAIQKEPAFTLAHYHRGYAHEWSGNKTQAIADYEKALRLEPDFKLAQERLSRLKK